MIKVFERRLGLPMPATFDRVRNAEQKVKDVIPGVEFVLVVGSDNALYLRIFCSDVSMTGAISELVKDDFPSTAYW
jgi:hypothetical protein